MVAKYLVSPHGGRRAFPDITSALSAAARRGRAALVEIAPGSYEETLRIQGEVQLVALDGPGSVIIRPPRGAALQTAGSVRVQGLVLIGRNTNVVSCDAGTLTVDNSEIWGHGGVGLRARPSTSAILTDSVVLHGRIVFAGAAGAVERCQFTDAADNAIAVVEGADVSVRGTRVEGSRNHGIRVSDARAQVSDCELTGTGAAAVVADTRAELTVTDCTISAVHAEAIIIIKQSRGFVSGTRVTDAQHGVAVASGAGAVVRDSTFAKCRDTAINLATAGRGRFENCEVFDAGNVAVFASQGGVPEVNGIQISRGNVGIVVTNTARGHFSRVEVEDLTSVALRVHDGATAVFEQVRVNRCPSHLETRGGAGTVAEVNSAAFRDFDMSAVEALGQSRVTLKNVTAERGLAGFGVAEGAQLFAYDCDITSVRAGAVVAMGKARVVAKNLNVTGSEALGLYGRDSAYLDVSNSTLVDCVAIGAKFDDACRGRLVNCSVIGKRGMAVRSNGGIDLVDLHTPLSVVSEATKPVETSPTVVNNYDGPVFHSAVHEVQLAWNNNKITQQQVSEVEPDA